MKVQRSHLRIAVVVLVLAVLYNLWVFFRPAPRTGAQANRGTQGMLQPEAPQRPSGPTPIDPLSIPAPPAVDLSSAAPGARDPFLFGDENRLGTPRPADVPREPDPLIRSILYSATRQTALVENRMLSVGDSIGTLKVAQIDRDAVIFVSADGERRRVALNRGSSAGIRR
jgi:hypothetical protein